MRLDCLGQVCGLSLIGLLTLTSCGGGEDPRSTVTYEPASLSEAEALTDVVNATTRFGAESLSELAQSQNTVVSPASILLGLAMLAEGAQGPAAEELDGLLGAAGAERTAAFSALQAAVLEYDGDPALVQADELPETPVLHLANQLVLADSTSPDGEFIDVLAASFDAGVVTTDFGAADSQRLLDEWVNEHTGGLIEESAVETPNADLIFVLQNAILMAARWQTQFDPADTAEREFTTIDGDTVEAETMQQTLEAEYMEYDDTQVIRLPYAEAFAMDVVLPPEGSAPTDFTDQDWAAVDAAFASQERTMVELALPAVDLQTGEDLVALLQDLGGPETVAGNDLSLIDPAVEIDQLAHQAVLTVDEEGTVAAAVTEIAGVTSAPVDPPEAVEMTVDRPFALRIVHEETNWPLFMAAIFDPTED
ncbi:serpin family protein [Nesterenkonia haasae]|uniref:serpin family protein n=1 Tax=Nesterenkonia haasae TaxID=2587813 RepID=UPI0013911C5B|nr:serpin family protein [Nesterenkonia haasae]NDK30954.1 serpin family protein [Nesterenkonia haasae]